MSYFRTVSIAGSESRTNTAYGTLTTPDQLKGIVVPANAIVAVVYRALWQMSVVDAARATVFFNSGGGDTQQTVGSSGAPATVAAGTVGATANTDMLLFSSPIGLVSAGSAGPGSVGNYMAIAFSSGVVAVTAEIGGAAPRIVAATPNGMGGPVWVQQVPAGTYTVSVQFKSSSGSVSAKSRQLWVAVLSPQTF